MTIQELKDQLALPIIVSPMFIVSGTKLVIECCKNGIVGSFPSLNGRTAEDFEAMLKEVTSSLKEFEETTGVKPAPYAVNIIVNRTNPRVQEDLMLCLKYKVPILITSLGAVKQVVDVVHSYGGLVFHDIVKKRHAEKAQEAGVDGIVCVSAGAGGHAGTANPFALVKEVKSFYDGATIMAGGINEGADVLAAQLMGADFAYMGTRFINTVECLAPTEYKEMIVNSEIGDVIYTPGVSGVPANFLKASIENAGIDVNEEKEEDFSKLSGSEAKAWKDIWSAGHGVTDIHDIPTVEELVSRLKKGYQEAIERVGKMGVK